MSFLIAPHLLNIVFGSFQEQAVDIHDKNIYFLTMVNVITLLGGKQNFSYFHTQASVQAHPANPSTLPDVLIKSFSLLTKLIDVCFIFENKRYYYFSCFWRSLSSSALIWYLPTLNTKLFNITCINGRRKLVRSFKQTTFSNSQLQHTIKLHILYVQRTCNAHVQIKSSTKEKQTLKSNHRL